MVGSQQEYLFSYGLYSIQLSVDYVQSMRFYFDSISSGNGRFSFINVFHHVSTFVSETLNKGTNINQE